MQKFFQTFLFLVHVLSSFGDDFSQHIRDLYNAGNVCYPPEGAWLPLPENVKCGISPCIWPSQMCSISKVAINGNPDVKCRNITKACREILKIGKQFRKLKIKTSIKKDEPTRTNIIEYDAPPSPPAKCQNGHDLCCYWASKGECDTNPVYMKIVCQQSCGTCGCKADHVEKCKGKVNLEECKINQNISESMNSAKAVIKSQCNQEGCNQPKPCGSSQGCDQTQPQPCGVSGEKGELCSSSKVDPCASGAGGGDDCPPPEKPCQKGIFPAQGGGCGANQYGGRGDCGESVGCGVGPSAVMQPRPAPAPAPKPDYQERPIGPAMNPTLGSGCKDFMQSCSSVSSNACQQSAFMGSVCKQSCNKC